MNNVPLKRRTGMSALRVPVRGDHRKRELLAIVGVGFTLTIIAGLYAASFRGLVALEGSDQGLLPRWETVSEEFFSDLRPSIDKLAETKASISAFIGAKQTQAQALSLLKSKIESADGMNQAVHASATPETPNP